MDFLLEALTNWLKEMLVGGIMSNLSGKRNLFFKYIPVKEQWYICGDISELLKDVDEPGL